MKCLSRSSGRPGTIYELLSSQGGVGQGRAGMGGGDTECPFFLPRTKDFQSKGALGKEWSCDYGCAEARLFSLSRGEYL